jgi:hypothetical protein
MEEREKVEVFERVVIAWNSGDLDGVVAELTPDFEWDCTHSGIPGLSEVYRGHEEYLQFAKSWRETLGPTQLMLEEARELDDGRLYVGSTKPQPGRRVASTWRSISRRFWSSTATRRAARSRLAAATRGSWQQG